MKKMYLVLAFAIMLIFNCLDLHAQIPFNSVVIEQSIGTGNNQLIFVLDYDSDSVGTDSCFAWYVFFDCDSLSGDSILRQIENEDANFSIDLVSGFLNNITYVKNMVSYTNPDVGWFSILESEDGISWNWNSGITDNVGDMDYIGIVTMNPNTYESEINVPVNTSSIFYTEASTYINFYPNPSHDFIKIQADGELHIYSLSGAEVYNTIVQKGDNVDISFLQKGVYQLMLINDNKIAVSKIIKQ